MIGSVSGAADQIIQLNQLDRQLSGHVSQRSQAVREKSAAAVDSLLTNAIESRQQALKSSTQGLKGTRINTYA